MKRGIILQNTKPFSQHFLWLSALYILGGSIITLPSSNANRLTFLGFIIAYILTVILTFAVLKINFLKYPVMLIALYSAGEVFVTFLNFISKSLLKNRLNFFTALIFITLILYFCFRKNREILNFSLVAGLLCAGLIIFFFFSTFKDFSFENIYISSAPDIKGLFSQSLPYIKSVTLPAAVLALYAKQIKASENAAIGGLAIGCGLLLLCILNAVLLFGTSLSGELPFPFAAAISTVTFGRLFSRLDGFCYFIYLACALIKITVCVFTVKFEISKRNTVYPQKTPYPHG